MSNLLINIRIVLVEPAGALNVGSIARVMKNMGLSHLTLVNPQCEYDGAEARQMAVHAIDLLQTARVVASLADGLAGCRRAIATTGRPRTPETLLEHPRAALPWLLDATAEPSSAALIFGPEDRGLNNEELHQAQRFVSIPANPEYPSLNLAQAVAVCCYELFQISSPLPTFEVGSVASKAAGDNLKTPHFPLPSAPLEELEGFYQHLQSLLLEVGYLYPHTAASRMNKFRRLFGRSLPTSDETAMLRGILSQVEWALKQRSRPPDQ